MCRNHRGLQTGLAVFQENRPEWQKDDQKPKTFNAEKCPVNSHNEWDPLEEIIVGRAEGEDNITHVCT